MPARAVAFDFNGTLSQDEPILCAVYRDLFAEEGRPLSEEDYYGTLAGHSEQTIIGTWLRSAARRVRKTRSAVTWESMTATT